MSSRTLVAEPAGPGADRPAPDAAGEGPHRGRTRTGRLESLDAFRGATIAAMLLVNNPGTWSAIYPPLRHAAWHGWTPTDLVFPFFLFIVGVASTFSLAKRRARGADDRALVLKIVRRSLTLIALGLVLHGFPDYDLATLRIPGVLQRIGLAYLVAAPIVAFTGWRTQAALTGVLLLGYWALLSLVPVPGGAAGVLEPGQDLGAWIDRQVFGTAHLWSQSRTWDPEGLLSTLPAVASVLLGALAGHWIRSGPAVDSPAATAAAPRFLRTATGLVVAGAAAVSLGLAWGLVLPINKPLWTSSYAVLTAGLASLCLAAMYVLIDGLGRRRWALPFVVFGTNAIAAYFLSSLGARVLNLIRVAGAGGEAVPLKRLIYTTAFEPHLSAPDASLAFAVTYVLVWLAVMTVLYRRRIFIKV